MLINKHLAEGKRLAAKAIFLPWGEHDLWWTRSGMAPYDAAKNNAAFAVWAANNAQALIAEVERLKKAVRDLREALIWCSGSADFGPGGMAEKGWITICRSLLEETKALVDEGGEDGNS